MKNEKGKVRRDYRENKAMRRRMLQMENAKEIIGEMRDGFVKFRFNENPAFLQSLFLL